MIDVQNVSKSFMLHNQGGNTGLRITYRVYKFDNIWPIDQGLEDFDLPLYFLLANRFQNFDYDLLSSVHAIAFEDITVFTTAYFS